MTQTETSAKETLWNESESDVLHENQKRQASSSCEAI